MARIVASVYMARDPLGGVLWWTLQWAAGLQALGHDVWLVEKANYPDAFFDPDRKVMADDAARGYSTAAAALATLGLGERFCVVDYDGRYHGLSRVAVSALFRSADVLLDLGNHGAWLNEAERCAARVLVDGEPGYTQMKMQMSLDSGAATAEYDYYYTNGANVGTDSCRAPAAGRRWRHVFNPVITAALAHKPPPAGAPFTTVMNWQAHAPFEFRGRTYGQKDLEFERFMDLPTRISVPVEIAVSGAKTPSARLEANGWRVRLGHAVTASMASYLGYIQGSAGEFSVCKNVFVATKAGWFSDRSAAYLGSGRPVVIQDTGIKRHLPIGEGLFAVESVEEAADAIERITADHSRHSKAARCIACEFLDTTVVLGRFLREIGI